MHIVTFTNKYVVVDSNEDNVAEFSSLQDAKNFILSNEDVNPENIIENPFYEVDDNGQFIGN